MREVYPVNELAENDLLRKDRECNMKYFCASKLWKCLVSHPLRKHTEMYWNAFNMEGEEKLRRTIGRNLSPLPWRTPGFQLFQYLILNWFLKRNAGGQRSFISRNITLKDYFTNDVLHLMKINWNITSITNLCLGRLGTISPSNSSLAGWA